MRSLLRSLSLAVLIAVVAPFPLSAQEEIKPGNRRIVGGEAADIESHPWQVALNVGGALCGGSIIGERWIVTAAHCFGGTREAGNVKAKAGVTDIVGRGDWADADAVFVHEAYNPATYENDVALVKLKRAANGHVIPLATKAVVVQVGQPLEVTGWGSIAEGGPVSPILRKASVPVVDPAVCNAPDAYNGGVKEHMLCAGRKEGGVDSCQGDSGGPLVLNSADGPELVGIVSWGIGCARKLKYGVYTRVADYCDWINGVIAAH